MATIILPPQKNLAEGAGSDLLLLRYEFCKSFVQATDKEFYVTLRESSTGSKIGQSSVTTVFSIVHSILTKTPTGSGRLAEPVKAIIRRVDKANQENKRLVVQHTINSKSTKEFQETFRKTMLQSALEIWYSYENQLRAVHRKVCGSKKKSMIKGLSFPLSKRDKDNLNSANAMVKISTNSNLQGVQKLAEFAGICCVHYLIEEKTADYPHKSILNPSLINTMKAKCRQLFVDRIQLHWTDSYKQKKSADTFFMDPVPAFSVPSSSTTVIVGTESAKNSSSSIVWLQTKDKELVLKSKSGHPNPKNNIHNGNNHQGMKSVLKFQLRRPFDFEQSIFQTSNNNVAHNNLSENYLKVQHDVIMNPENANENASDNYFVWTDHSADVSQIYNQLMEDHDFDKDQVTLKYFKEILDILTRDSMTIEQTHQLTADTKSKLEAIEEKIDSAIMTSLEAEASGSGSSSSKTKFVTAGSVKAVRSFTLRELPPTLFTGREEILTEIHKLLLQAENDKTEPIKRMVVLVGLGGIGKSSTAKKYAQNYMDCHKNVAWMDAESWTSLEKSFRLLAKRLGLHTTPDSNGMDMAKNVYHHFSTHVKKGLFILDNAANFGELCDFLPSEHLENFPLFLLTSRNKSCWQSCGGMIELNRLNGMETFNFLRKALLGLEKNIPEISSLEKKDGENDIVGEWDFLKKSLTNLGELLGGYPLALNLAAASISESLKLVTFQNFTVRPDQVKYELDSFVKEFHQNGQKWVNLQGSGSGRGPGRGSSELGMDRYENIIATVWTGTMEKIGNVPDDGKMALNLLNLMAYLPADLIFVEICNLIYYDSKFHRKLLNYKTTDSAHRAVRRAFGLLEKYSMVSILPQFDRRTFPQLWTNSTPLSTVQIHQCVQKWVREDLKSAKNFKPLLKLAHYFQYNFVSSEYWDCIRDHLRETEWPDKSYRLSIFIHRGGVYPWGMRPWKEMFGHFTKEKELQKSDVEYFVMCKLALIFYQHLVPEQQVTSSSSKGKRMLDNVVLFGAGDAWTKLSLETFLDFTLTHGIKHQSNQVMQQLAAKIINHATYLHGCHDFLQKRKRRLRQWAHGWFQFYETTKTVISYALSSRNPLPFLDLADEVLSTQELVKMVAKTVSFRLQHDDNLYCYELLHQTICLVDDWPSNIWKRQRQPYSNPDNQDKAHQLFRKFLKNGGLRLLEQACTKGHIWTFRSSLIFDTIQNLAYFKGSSKKLLKSGCFQKALGDALKLSINVAEGTKEFWDRRVLVDIIFSLFALLGHTENRLKSFCEPSILIWDHMNCFLLILESTNVGVGGLNRCSEYVRQIQEKRFWSARKNILDAFLETASDGTREQNEKEGRVYRLAGKLNEILMDRKANFFKGSQLEFEISRKQWLTRRSSS